jgi:nitrilase
MRASVIQFEAGVDKAANIAAASALIEAAVAREQATFISLPEMWSCLGGDRAAKAAAAEVLPPAGEGGEAGRQRIGALPQDPHVRHHNAQRPGLP